MIETTKEYYGRKAGDMNHELREVSMERKPITENQQKEQELKKLLKMAHTLPEITAIQLASVIYDRHGWKREDWMPERPKPAR